MSATDYHRIHIDLLREDVNQLRKDMRKIERQINNTRIGMLMISIGLAIYSAYRIIF
jgi:phage shock protein A